MRVSSNQPRGINSWLICTSLVVALVACSAEARDLKRVLSIGKTLLSHRGSDKVDYSDPNQYETDDSLITRNPKSSTVSKALRYLHKRSEDSLLKRSNSIKQSEPSNQNELAREAPESGQIPYGAKLGYQDGLQMDDRTDDQVIMDACKDRPTKPCALTVKVALKKPAEVKHKIAIALRNKPDFMDGPKLLYHKMFEAAIKDVEENNIDDKLELAGDVLLSINPATRTGMIVSKIAKTAIKPALNHQLDKSLAPSSTTQPDKLSRSPSGRFSSLKSLSGH